MKKISIILSLLLIFACEDDKADETAAVNFDGTYKLSLASSDCRDGLNNRINKLDVKYITIDGKKLIIWDFMGDDCNTSGQYSCYSTWTYDSVKRDGDILKLMYAGVEEWIISKDEMNGLKLEIPSKKIIDIYEYEVSEVKTYSPICN
ncbi:hypothetical protein OAD01_04200 [Candidatus Marinimicrobia bacterium]|nr:hypothetical protein [Candidatus Neomarinimicrobiota bacterium]